MSKDKGQLLETNICNCGTSFKVDEVIKDKTFQPGSKGFLSYIMGPDCNCPNVVFYKVVTIRRGKGGKQRLNENMILVPIFNLPGVPLEFTIPSNVERKYFVNIDVNPTDTVDEAALKFTSSKDRLHFLGQLLARASFAKELDRVVFPNEHQVTQAIGTNGDTRNGNPKIWPTGKTAILKSFQDSVENLFSYEDYAVIEDKFWNAEKRGTLRSQLHRVEVALTIPKLEYQRKVGETMKEALVYIDKKLKTKEAKDFENIGELKASVKLTTEAVDSAIKTTKHAINKRLSIIAKNRKLLKF